MNAKLHQNQIILKDGRSTLGTWAHESSGSVTVGDRIEIPSNIAGDHRGYGAEAIVSRIELDTQTGVYNIEAEVQSDVPTSKRPVVTLNSSLVPTHLHDRFENFVRGKLNVPVIEWEDSFETNPVIRLHQHDDNSRTTLADLQADLRAELHGSLDHASL